MSTPQDPRNPGEPPRDSGEPPQQNRPPQSHGGPEQHHGEPPLDSDPEPDGPGPGERPAGNRTPEAPDESGAAAGVPRPPSQSGDQPRSGAEPVGSDRPVSGETPISSDDPPTEYLPKILHRESSGTGSHRTGAAAGPESPEPGVSSPADDHPTQMLPKQPGQPEESGAEAPRMDKGTAAYAHGWQPSSSGQQPGHQPMGEVPPQAWSAQPEEQEPGQAWQPQSPGQQPGYSQPGGAPYPPPGAYGGRTEQPGDRSGWETPPSEQSGWGTGQAGQQGWGADQPRQQGWSGGQPGQQGWSGGQPGQQDWGAEQPGQHGWGVGPSGQQGWSGAQPGQPGWGGVQQPSGYPAYPQQQQYQPYGATQQPERSGPQVLSIIGFVCAAVSLLFCPLLFGIAGIALGVIGHIRGESLGKWAAIAAGVCLIIGMVLALALSGMDVVPIETS
ncbi:hypothetical protein [Nocardia carnea]|uniref:hypothetical protein n=1 Tax=Nocardia carnea TaxID=37328 RepID=UPI0024579760|nr:hypothetical protein [Nocardia carnea]